MLKMELAVCQESPIGYRLLPALYVKKGVKMLNYKKKEIPAITDLLALYSSVGWTNILNNPTSTLKRKLSKPSLWQLAVYDEGRVSSLHSLGRRWVTLLSFLVRPDYQRQGIGKTLRKGFSDVPQCLSTAPCH